MANKKRKIIINVTKEMEPLLEKAQNDLFGDCNQEDMINKLIKVGLRVMEEEKAKKNKSEQKV